MKILKVSSGVIVLLSLIVMMGCEEPIDKFVSPDTEPPINVGILINNGDSYTWTVNVTLTLSVLHSADVEMIISNDPNFSGATWEPFTSSKTWTLIQGDGEKTVYAKFRDVVGNETSPVSDSIILDSTSPAGLIIINNGDEYTNQLSVTLTLSASFKPIVQRGPAKVIGRLSSEEMLISNRPDFSGAIWQAYASPIEWTLDAGDGVKTVYAKFRDKAGNESDVASDSIILDTTPPSSPSLAINEDDLYTTDPSVTLSLSVVGGDSMMVSNRSDFRDARWEIYTPAMGWMLEGDDGEKTVYARFKDLAGNESDVVSDEIILDTIAPSSPEVLINNDDAYTTDQSVALTLSAVDADFMLISNRSDFNGADWEDYATSKDWLLDPADGEKTVYVKFKDTAGNESLPASDAINLYETATLILFYPDPAYVSAGNQVKVDVRVENVANLVSAYVSFSFDPEKVEVTDLKVNIANSLLGSTGARVIVSDRDVDNDAGSVTFGALAQQTGFTGVSGDGPIATVTFLARVADPTSNIVFRTVKLYDYPVAVPPVPISGVVSIDGHILPPQ